MIFRNAWNARIINGMVKKCIINKTGQNETPKRLCNYTMTVQLAGYISSTKSVQNYSAQVLPVLLECTFLLTQYRAHVYSASGKPKNILKLVHSFSPTYCNAGSYFCSYSAAYCKYRTVHIVCDVRTVCRWYKLPYQCILYYTVPQRLRFKTHVAVSTLYGAIKYTVHVD